MFLMGGFYCQNLADITKMTQTANIDTDKHRQMPVVPNVTLLMC